MEILDGAGPLEGEEDLKSYFKRAAAAPARALLLDYDGTIAPFTPDRDRAFPYPGVVGFIADIMGAEQSRVVIVSGRAVRDIVPVLGMRPMPELWGSHGWERLTPGQYVPRTGGLDPAVTRALGDARDWAHEAGLADRCESKPGCLALHWRGLPEDEIDELRTLASEAWRPLTEDGKISFVPFDGGVELRAAGRTKATAVETILREAGKGAAVAYLGDDLTDEDAFEALGQKGLSVLVRAEARESAAHVRLRPPGELLDFLRDWSTACGPPARRP